MDATTYDILTSVDTSGLQSMLMFVFYELLSMFGVIVVFLAYELEEEKYWAAEGTAQVAQAPKTFKTDSIGYYSFFNAKVRILGYQYIPYVAKATLLIGLLGLGGCDWERPTQKEGNWYSIPSPPGSPGVSCWYFIAQGGSNGTGGVVCF
jgi:hypothetical protein